jgi:zinc/manganese transport system substrate-binding protein
MKETVMPRLLRQFGVLFCSTLFTGALAWEVPAQNDQLEVVTTILPISQFTLAVAGDRATVTPLIPTNMGPHGFQARPQDAQMLSNADVLVINGLEMEGFLDGLIENAGNPDLVMIDTSEGIATIATAEGHDHGHEGEHGHSDKEDHDHAHEEEHSHEEDHAHEDHDHGDEHGHSDKEDHDHEHGDHDHGHSHGEFDPHVWLDPKRAIQQVENIRDGLIAADPEGEEAYTANAAAFIDELRTLDQEISTRLQPYEGKPFVVFHDFAAYFADSYGLESEFLVEAPEENAAPEDVRRIMETVQEAGLQTVLTEPQADGGSPFEAIAQDLGIQVSVFDPLETGPETALDPEYYLTIMRQNAENLASAFAAESAALPQVPVVGWAQGISQ